MNFTEKLFIETVEGKMELDIKVIEKYHLEKGTYSPFTRSRIVDENGDFTKPKPVIEKPKKKNKFHDGEIDEEVMEDNGTENVKLTTSEMLDFAQGSDSYQ